MNYDQGKHEWDNRWTKDFIVALTFDEYKSKMGVIVKDLLDELKSTLDLLNISNSKIMDIGGGYGANLKFLFNASNEKYLVDISDVGIKIAQNIYKITNAYCLDILSDELPDSRKYDLVLLNEVIEHIHPVEHKVLINKIHSILAPNGKLIITTPNLASLSSRLLLLFGKIPVTYALDESHIAVFTSRSLNRMITKCGFKRLKLITTRVRLINIKYKFPFRLNLGEHIIGIWEKVENE